MNFGDEERQAYEEHLKWLRIEANTLKKYEAKGFMEGKAEGKAEIAKTMLRKGMEINTISELTELTLHQIETLKQKI
jgi:predicted transposase/invertase (TIGR01784 family)